MAPQYIVVYAPQRDVTLAEALEVSGITLAAAALKRGCPEPDP